MTFDTPHSPPLRLLVIASMLALFGATSTLQDAGKVLSDVDRTLGAAGVKSLRYSGTGFAYAFGQNPRPDVRYPKFYAKYVRTLDYEKGLSREETVRTQFENPPSGGGGQPLYTEAPGTAIAGASSAWGGGAIALTPHGFVQAAMTARPTMSSARVGGKTFTVLSFTARDKYKVSGYVNAQNLLERVDTWVANPTLGDTLIETTYAEYRDFGGVKFPMRVVQKQGGFPVLELTVTDVQPNVAVNIQAPSGAPQPVSVEAEKVGDGVWYLRGTPDPNSQLVEFKDFLVIVESSVTEERALANIAEAKRLVPNKPIRYHVNSHHHSDHSAGVRAFVAEGSTIVTHEMNKRFYDQVVLKSPHALAPDTLSRNPRPANFVYVKDKGKYVISDGARTMEIYHVPNGHTANLLMSYLPHEKLLLITDIYNDFGMPRPNDTPPGIVSPYYAALGDRIKELKLDVQRLAPSHGRTVNPVDRLRSLLQGTVQAPPVRPATDSK